MKKKTGPLKVHSKKFQDGSGGFCRIRVLYRKGGKKESPYYIFKCGDCEEELVIYHSNEDLEINGVTGSIENWRKIFFPLLGIKQTNKGFVDIRE